MITWQAGALKRSRLKTGGGSYLSSHDPREILGVGARRRSISSRYVGPAAKLIS